MAEHNRYHPSNIHTLHTLIFPSFIFQAGFNAPHPQNGSTISPELAPTSLPQLYLPLKMEGSNFPPIELNTAQDRLDIPPLAPTSTPKLDPIPLNQHPQTWLQRFPKTSSNVFPLPGSNNPLCKLAPTSCPLQFPLCRPSARPLTHFRGIPKPPAPQLPQDVLATRASLFGLLLLFLTASLSPKAQTLRWLPDLLAEVFPSSPRCPYGRTLTNWASKPDPSQSSPTRPCPQTTRHQSSLFPVYPHLHSQPGSHPRLLLHLHPSPCPLSRLQNSIAWGWSKALSPPWPQSSYLKLEDVSPNQTHLISLLPWGSKLSTPCSLSGSPECPLHPPPASISPCSLAGTLPR